MSDAYAGFEAITLEDGHHFFVSQLPHPLMPDDASFEVLWRLHPAEYHVVQMVGREVPTPRWQQAYGVDYQYTGNTNAALEVPTVLKLYWTWARRSVDERLSSLLLNWYDGSLGHYIGPHHDSVKNMTPGAPIVTISLGEERTFRLTLASPKVTRDFTARHGSVFIIPYDTNLAWKHAVPKTAKARARRISLTLRGLQFDSAPRRPLD